jgi:hypothetical protein
MLAERDRAREEHALKAFLGLAIQSVERQSVKAVQVWKSPERTIYCILILVDTSVLMVIRKTRHDATERSTWENCTIGKRREVSDGKRHHYLLFGPEDIRRK